MLRKRAASSLTDPVLDPVAGVLGKLEADFHVSKRQLREILKAFYSEMEEALTKDVSNGIKMLPSFLDRLPTGEERGTYFGLDLGGSYFRVVETELEGQGHVRSRQKSFPVPEACKTGSVTDLFDFMADCVMSFFLESHADPSYPFKLGFTFSFPAQQTGVADGILIQWNKGFSLPQAIGKDIVQLLHEALERKGIRARVAILLNDTVGTLVALSYSKPQCRMGIIFGTGTNAAYVEKLANIRKYRGPASSTGRMIINMEWGAFDERRRALPMTKYDLQMDQNSLNPNKQCYEKMISGMYLGEIVRYACLDLIAAGELFIGQSCPIRFRKPFAFETAYMSRIERDHSESLHDTATVLRESMGVSDPSFEDRRIVKHVCELIGIRAARLSAVGIAAVLTKMGEFDGCAVAIDGSVFEFYPDFSSRMRDALQELVGMFADNVDLVLTKDGSGVGAGLSAAVVS